MSVERCGLLPGAAAVPVAKGKYLESPEKDILGSRHFKVVGAEIDASDRTKSVGLTTVVAAPLQKRIALSVLTLRVAQLPCISSDLAARLTGNWTSVFMFRRCLTCLMNEIYKFASEDKSKNHEVFEMPRSTAQELVLSAIFSFLAISDVSVSYLDRLFATDASMRQGAVVSRPIMPDIAKVLWLGGDKKGAYTTLDAPFRELRRALGDEEVEREDEAADFGLSTSAGFDEPPRRSLDFSFDFVEICGGAASVSSFLAKRGFEVMPPIELSDSPHYDVRQLRLIEWLCDMLRTGRLRLVMVEPVCTTFSPTAHPAVRSYKEPKGFNRQCAKTWLGNCIAFRCLFLLWYASACNRPALGEQPGLSKMAWLSIWRFLLEYKAFREAIVASCQFGSIHRKEFRMIGWGIDMERLEVRCPGGHQHVPIEGRFTKPSAMYVPALAEHFGRAFEVALRRKRAEEADCMQLQGVESVLAKDLLVSGSWELEFAWHWRKPSHINILESSAYVALLKKLTREGGDMREEQMRAERRSSVTLVAERAILQQTRTRRDVLLDKFDQWLLEHAGFSLASLVDSQTADPELISEWLIAYGKDLYYSGKSYGRFSETVNGIAARRPLLKRQLTGAWNLAFAWVADEPHTHHPAMPLSILLSFVTLSLLWGWPREAAMMMMMIWTGIMRVGEALAARRQDLVLPCDGAPGRGFALILIHQPKTRGVAAKHQSARVDPSDAVMLLSAVFGPLGAGDMLWNRSPSALRRRFSTLARALGLPTTRTAEAVPYDLASLRAGGATFLLNRFEDSELVRRRGRWMSSRVMEVYLQEIVVATHTGSLTKQTRCRVDQLVQAYTKVLQRSVFLLRSQIPSDAWPKLWLENHATFDGWKQERLSGLNCIKLVHTMGCCASGAPVGVLLNKPPGPRGGTRWRKAAHEEGVLVDDQVACQVVGQGSKFPTNIPTQSTVDSHSEPDVAYGSNTESLLAGVVLQVASPASREVPQKRPPRKAVTWGGAEVCEYEPRRHIRRVTFVRPNARLEESQ
eukprot:s777_g26.t1